ncbi:MAG: hypothetical protein KJO98_13450 [Rhodothermia bacterium]|nr:hypothetical protein [Rhodothermia bacterium]
MPIPVHILWVDDYHLGDPLFTQSLARHLALVEPDSRRVLAVHGGGERAERLLELRGREVVRTDGVLQISDDEDKAVVERALREVNKDVTGVLTEFGVPAVGIQGSDRGLLKIGKDGTPRADKSDWLLSLVDSGSVPVVSSLAGGADGAQEIATADAVVAIAKARGLDDCLVVVFPRSGSAGVIKEGVHQAEISPNQLLDNIFDGQKDGLDSLVRNGFSVRLTSARHAISADPGRFTRVLAAKTP